MDSDQTAGSATSIAAPSPYPDQHVPADDGTFGGVVERRDRPGECSIDVMAVLHALKFGCGPSPSDMHAVDEATDLGLISSERFDVTPRGEAALAEHGWLAPGEMGARES